MRDLPTGPALLALSREILLNGLLPLLPPEARLDARLVANSMAIAEREALAGSDAEEHRRARDIEALYADAARTAIAGESRGSQNLVPGEADESEAEPLRRFSRDLRSGAFEDSPQCDRGALDILWRLTIAKLRRANPRFLAANGLG